MNETGLDRIKAYLPIIGLIIFIHIAFVFAGISPVLQGHLGDTDAYMRALRVEHLATGGGWFNATELRMNAPYGDVQNWTRPLDVVILAGALPLVAYMDMSWHDAIFWIGVFISPLFHLTLGLCVAWAAAPLVALSLRPLVLMLVCLQPVSIAYGMAGRPDHQTFLLIPLMLMVGFGVRILSGQGAALRAGLWSGVCAACALWITVEAEYYSLAFVGIMGLIWLVQGQRRIILALEAFGLGMVVMVLLGLLAERGFAGALARELDKISLTQFYAVVVQAVALGGLAAYGQGGRVRRVLSALLAVIFALTALSAFAPEIFLGTTGQVDPRVLQMFFLQIREMRPLLPVDAESTGLCLFYLATPLAALGAFYWGVKAALPPTRPAWLMLGGLTAIFTIAALLHARFAQVPACLAPILLAGIAQQVAQAKTEQRLRHVLWHIGLFIMPLFVSLLAPMLQSANAGDAREAYPSCVVTDFAAELNKLPKGIILSHLNYGPDILYFTHHDVVAGPYHRNTAGILDSIDFFEGDDAAAKAILAKRGVRYVLACNAENKPPTPRLKALLEGHAPAWLHPLTLGHEKNAKIYQFNN